MESLSIICAVLCGLAVWLWPRRNVCDVGERAGNVVGRAGESLDEKPDGGFGGRSDGIEEANMPAKPLPAIGCVACVASLRASVRSGATLVQASKNWVERRSPHPNLPASHNHGDPQPMPAQRAMRPSRTAERRAICGLPVKSDARMRNRPMPASGAESLKRQRLLMICVPTRSPCPKRR